eukprot:7767418-Karenia_brevis.AAC.1
MVRLLRDDTELAYINNEENFSMMEHHVRRLGIYNKRRGHIRRSKSHARNVAEGNGDPLVISHGKNAHQQRIFVDFEGQPS